MGKVITFGLQKGGVSKTTTTGIVAYMMANDGYKVLAVDMDSQGNLTELLTDESSNEFLNQSIFEAIAYKEPEKYIHKVNENIDLLPANNLFASFAKWLYTYYMPHTEKVHVKVKYEGKEVEQLARTLEIVKDNYDYILIDTPPALSEQTINALYASDYVVVLYESSKFCYSAIPNFMETVAFVQHLNNLEVLGILRTLNDVRRKDAHLLNELIAKDYPDLVFETIITRKASIGRLPLRGFNEENTELDEALSQFQGFYKELKKRLKEWE